MFWQGQVKPTPAGTGLLIFSFPRDLLRICSLRIPSAVSSSSCQVFSWGVFREAEVQKSIHVCAHWNGIQNHVSETCFHLGNTPAQEVRFTHCTLRRIDLQCWRVGWSFLLCNFILGKGLQSLFYICLLPFVSKNLRVGYISFFSVVSYHYCNENSPQKLPLKGKGREAFVLQQPSGFKKYGDLELPTP